MSNLRDVAKLAGVSLTTASYAMNYTGNISQETRDKVFQAANVLNYKEKKYVSSIKKCDKKAFALVTAGHDGPFFSMLAKNIQESIKDTEYNLLFCTSTDKILNYFMNEKNIEGMIFMSSVIEDSRLLKISEEVCPVIVLDRELTGDRLYSITVDNFSGGYEITKYLLAMGHRKIVFIGGNSNHKESIKRYEGYKKALEDFSLAPEMHYECMLDKEGGYSIAKSVITHKSNFDAVFCANDEVAIGLIRALEEENLSVPKDISVVGFDDIDWCSYMTPRLTTIRQPIKDIAAFSVKNLIKILNNEDVSKSIKLNTEIVIRESVSSR